MIQIIEWIAITIALATTPPTPTAPPPPSYFEGSLSRYDPGVMNRVIDWRYQNGIPEWFDPHREDYDGFVAVIDCRNVGRSGSMTVIIDGEERGTFRVYVSDCASPGTRAARWMIKANVAAEIDYDTWKEWGIVDGRGAWVEIVLDDS